jgi:thiol-disulfide isomerase/thioredoxin
MKRNLLGMMIFLFTITMSFGQNILLSEDFDDGTLGEFTTIDGDMATPAPNVAAFAGGFIPGETGLGLGAVATSWFTAITPADNWLITPAVEIADAGTLFTWDAGSIDANYPDGYRVVVSTTGNEIANFTDELFSIVGEPAGVLTRRGVNLDDYVGQTIYIAFHHNSTDEFLLVIDNVSVVQLRDYDIAANADLSYYRFGDMGTDNPISVSITNAGSQVITSLDASYEINGNTVTETFDGLNLAALETTTLTFTENYTLDNANENDIEITISNPNGEMDQDMTNNGLSEQIVGVMNGPAKQIFVEEATGTWCPFCPRGAVFMDLMEEQYGDFFAGVAVHRGNTGWDDPMEVSGYGAPFANLVSGFPTLVIDRGTNPGIPGINDMSTFGQALIDFTNSRPSPVGVDISAEINPFTREMAITVSGTSHSNLTGTNYNLSLLVTEDHVTGGAFAYRQANAYAGGGLGPMDGYENLPNPISGDEIEYNHTLRAALTGFDGAAGLFPTDIAAGETYTATYTYTIPLGQDLEEQNIVAVIYDMNEGGVAYNANTLRKVPTLVSSTADLLDEDVVKVFPNPVTDGLTNIRLNLVDAQPVTVQILNTVGATVATQNFGTLNGTNVLPFNTEDIPAGMYYIHVRVGDKISTEKISVIR